MEDFKEQKASEGKILIKDGMMAKHIYLPIDEDFWIEIDEPIENDIL